MPAVILGTMNPSRPCFPTLNRPETHVAVAEYQDVRLGGSDGTNPARRFWTRLPVVLPRCANSSAISGRPSNQNPDSISFSPIRAGGHRSQAGRALVVEVE
jgi:hypothetical protein